MVGLGRCRTGSWWLQRDVRTLFGSLSGVRVKSGCAGSGLGSIWLVFGVRLLASEYTLQAVIKIWPSTATIGVGESDSNKMSVKNACRRHHHCSERVGGINRHRWRTCKQSSDSS